MLSIRAAVCHESRSDRMKAAPFRSMENEPVWAKIARLQQGGVPRVFDLFAGCGGLSLGLQRAGFAILAGLDSDPQASASHARNFHAGCPRHALPQDLTDPEVTPENVCARLGLGRADASVDVVVGGPPCQAFARIGRAKLREIAGDPEAFLKDPRAGLHERWVAWVRELKPLAVLRSRNGNDGASGWSTGSAVLQFDLEERIPDDHLLRRIDAALDLSWLRAELAPFCPSHGMSLGSIPELMVRMLLIGYCYSIPLRAPALSRGRAQPCLSVVLPARPRGQGASPFHLFGQSSRPLPRQRCLAPGVREHRPPVHGDGAGRGRRLCGGRQRDRGQCRRAAPADRGERGRVDGRQTARRPVREYLAARDGEHAPTNPSVSPKRCRLQTRGRAPSASGSVAA